MEDSDPCRKPDAHWCFGVSCTVQSKLDSSYRNGYIYKDIFATCSWFTTDGKAKLKSYPRKGGFWADYDITEKVRMDGTEQKDVQKEEGRK